MLTIYADLNCPFCYVLNEWIEDAGLSSTVDWRLVNHNPQADYRSYDNQSLMELTDEVFTIRYRAPDISIVLPRGRSNSGNAEILLCEVKKSNPSLYNKLKQIIYRAYWFEDKNIESLAYLTEIAGAEGIDHINLNEDARRQIQTWTDEWRKGPFEERLPVIKRSNNDFLLGLPLKDEVINYVMLGNKTSFTGSTCDYLKKPRVTVLGDWPFFWAVGQALRHDTEILFCPSWKLLQNRLDQAKEPDAIIVAYRQINKSTLAQIEKIAKNCQRNNYPLLVLSQMISDAKELELYQLGCDDVLSQNKPMDTLLIKIHKILQSKQAHKKLLQLSLTDSLTGLANKRFFYSRLEQEWGNSQRSRQSLSVLMVDIDFFKLYNDEYGHLSGDGCLREVSLLMKDQIKRETDAVFRVGGEEFALLLPYTNLEGATSIAQNIINGMHKLAIPHSQSEFKIVTLSIGICSMINDRGFSVMDLVESADKQLYQAKKSGRNKYCLESPVNC